MRGLLLAVCGASLATLAPRVASARETQLEFQGALEASGTWLRTTPTFSISEDGGARTVRGRLPSVGHLTLMGGAVEASVTVNDKWVFPITGFGLSGAIGSSPRVLGSVDGSIAELRPWSSFVADVLLPGFGVRFKERRWMFSALARTGVSILQMNGTLYAGADGADISPTALTFVVRAQLEACRRLDPLERICVSVAPNLYEFGFLNGGMLGMRWEVGP